MFQEAVYLELNYHRFLAPGFQQFQHIPQSHKNNTNSNNANHPNQAWKACFFTIQYQNHLLINNMAAS